MNLKINSFALIIVLLLAGAASIYYLSAANHNSSKLIEEIEDYREKHGEGANLDITPVISQHLKVGMPREEVISFFSEMRFIVTESHFDTWHDNKKSDQVYSAMHNENVGPSIFHIYIVYNYLLYFKNGKLVDFNGVVRREQP